MNNNGKNCLTYTTYENGVKIESRLKLEDVTERLADELAENGELLVGDGGMSILCEQTGEWMTMEQAKTLVRHIR